MLWKRKPPFTSALWPQQIDSSQILLMLLAVDDRSWETSRFLQGKGWKKGLVVIHSYSDGASLISV